MKKMFLFSAFLLVTAMNSAQAKSSCQSGTQQIPELTAVLAPRAPSHYQDLLDRCASYISDLASTQRRADLVARTGNLKQAAKILADGLAEKAATLPRPFSSDYVPHTIEAIRNGNKIAKAVIAESNGRGSEVLSAQIQMVTLNEVYNLVRVAYYELDERYFTDYANRCRYRCSWGFPNSYYDGVRHLAQQFLNLHGRLSRLSAYDRVELKMSSVVAGSAKNILANSLFRRDFACEVRELHSIEQDVNDYLNCGGNGLPISWFVQDIRNRMDSINLNRYRCH